MNMAELARAHKRLQRAEQKHLYDLIVELSNRLTPAQRKTAIEILQGRIYK